MKKFLTLSVVLSSLGLCHGQDFQAILSSYNEVPPNSDSDSSGTIGTYAFADLTLSGMSLNVTSAFYGNMPGVPTEISIDDGPAGQNGTFLFDLTINGDSFPVGSSGETTLYDGSYTGSGTLTSQQVTDLENGNLYVNIQTVSNPTPGEVRGQIAAVPEPGTMALMAAGFVGWLGMKRRKA